MAAEAQVRDIMMSVLTYVVPTLASAGITYFFTARHYRRRKKYEFAERRLNELYGPLCSHVGQLKADSGLRVAIFQAKNEAWQDKCKRSPVPFLNHEKAFAPFRRSIDYENRQFCDAVMPIYDEMLTILNTKRHLAFQSTVAHYDAFCRFVQLWHRRLDDAIPGEAIEKIGVREEELQPFYSEIETRHAALVQRLSGDRRYRNRLRKDKKR